MSLLTPMLHHSNCVIWSNFTAWTAAFRQTSVPKFRMQDEPLFNFETTSVASRSTLRDHTDSCLNQVAYLQSKHGIKVQYNST